MNAKAISFEELFPLISEKIAEGKSFSFLAFGKSMLPFLKNGVDTVTLSPVKGNLEKNDVIFYRRKSGQFILHRIVKILDNGEIWLCGDNQYFIEKGIYKDQVIAILTSVNRKGKDICLTSFMQKLYLTYLPVRRSVFLLGYKIKNRIKRILKRK